MGSGAISFPHLLCNRTQLELQVIKTIHIFYLYKWIIHLPQYLEQWNYPKHLIQCTMIKTLRFQFKKNKTNFTCLKNKTEKCIHSTWYFMFLCSFNDIFNQTLNETSYHRDLLLGCLGFGGPLLELFNVVPCYLFSRSCRWCERSAARVDFIALQCYV